MNKEQYCGTTVILESKQINIPNAKKCRVNHGLVTAIPCEDMTFGVFKRKKFILKSSNKNNNRESFKNVSR